MVVGVAAREPVGVDVERIRPRTQEQIGAALDLAELEELGGDPVHAYFCGWVAKEATLKRHRAGLSQLSRTRIVEAWSDGAWVSFDGERNLVAYTFLSGHVAAVTGPAAQTDWMVMIDHRRNLPPEPRRTFEPLVPVRLTA